MESVENGQFRLKLALGKFRVIERNGRTMKVALGGSTTMTFILPDDNADVREGDILTFYTEVLYAPPKPTSIQ
jgi:hypothetical protein